MKIIFESKWAYISIFIYTIVKTIEYTTGAKETPVWVNDFFPLICLIMFLLLDKIISKIENKSQGDEK